ncbi:histidine kinase dimerization/phospho-acceptor domain-containing protein [Rothia sp. ZJ932]|uniref:HAMP domain-containing sensor histidine kinase n=1 Tax=Rothia sp. ZJ932 TaxID=2810516 RepID=UPI001967304A|nr:histidine kinase dimerization/phospho-acceptor domain-containing protein [Rothia sp. ZJ932]QRZ61042.1 HAMP domain-containing protein [Rothia sp. ZJ932]
MTSTTTVMMIKNRLNRLRFISSSRWRIIAWMMLATSFAILGLIFSVREILLSDLDREANDQIIREISEFREFSQESTDPTAPLPYNNLEDMMQTYISRQFFGTSGQLIGVTDSQVLYLKEQDNQASATGYRVHQDTDLLDTITRSESASGVENTPDGPVHWGKTSISITTNDGKDEGQLIVVQYIQPQLDDIRFIINTMVGVGFAGLLLTSVFSWFIAGQILKPIRTLRTVAEDITDKNISARVPVQGDDDISAMSMTFNQMLDRLEASSTMQRQFLDDVSHELRTPITIVRGHLELMERTTQDQQATLDLVDDELERMGRIVGDLLLLAKSERPDFVRPQRTDVADLIISLESKVQAVGKHRWVISDIAEGEVNLDAQRVTQAMIQLAANAAQYSPENSVISLGTAYVDREGRKHLNLWVQDQGPGVDPNDAPHLFDRYRRESSRNPNAIEKHALGAGIGLAIVQAIAESHDGSVWVATPDSEIGSVFGLSIPTDLSLDMKVSA